MNILHVSIGALPAVFSERGGAVQRRVAELSVAQARRGHRVTIHSPATHAQSVSRDGVEVRYLACRSSSPLRHIEFLARSRAAARGRRFDVVHVHNEPEGAVFFAGIAPTVLSFDNFYFRQRIGARLRPLYRRALARYALLLPVSDYCQSGALEHWSLSPARSVVLPNGVDLDQFAPAPDGAAAMRERLDIRGDVVVSLGRVCRQKGTHVLLEAFAQLRQQREATLVVAGPIGQFADAPDDVGEWERALDAVGARYLGAVHERDLSALLTLADVFAMPTIELEMQGMAALEAQACGTPVVASDHGGLRETVPDGCGVRVPPGDARALADALAELLDAPARRAQLGHTAREHASSLAWGRIAERAETAYSRAGVHDV